MKAAVLYQARQPLKTEELEMPEVGDDDVLIRVAACGVCHTDLKVVEGRSPFISPTILGHEVSGIIEQVGNRQRTLFKVGDRVIIGMRYKCGSCRYCLAGRENLCARRPAPPPFKKNDGTVITRWNVGGFAQYLAVPGYMVFPVPDGLSLDEASVIGCRVTTAYNAVKHGAELEPGDSALVMGCGGIGLNTIQPDDSAYYGGVDSLQLAWPTRDVAAVPTATPASVRVGTHSPRPVRVPLPRHTLIGIGLDLLAPGTLGT